MPERMHRSVPWRYGDLLALVGSVFAGFVLVGVSFYSTNRTSDLASQVRWTNVAVVGVVVLGVGNLLWLITGRRAIGELRRLLLPRLAAIEPPHVAVGVDAVSDSADGASFVASRAMTKYHHPSCALVRGKAVRAASLAVHEGRGRRPCGVCRPPARSDG